MFYMNNLIEKFFLVKGYSFLGIDLVRLIIAILFLTIILLLRRLLTRFIIGRLHKMIDRKAKPVYSQIISALEPVVYYIPILLSLWISFFISGIKILYPFVNHGGYTSLIVIITWGLYRISDFVIKYHREVIFVKKEKKFASYLSLVIGRVVKILIILTGLVTVFQEWGYNASTILAGLGIGGLAVALASKDFVANIFGFITLLLDRSISPGDMIVTSSIEGWVEDIGFRSTKIRTKKHTLITVPNSVIANAPIENITQLKKRCITFNLNVTCAGGIKEIEEFCNRVKQMLVEHPDVLDENIHVYFTDFTDASYTIFFYYFSRYLSWLEHLEVKHDVNLRIMKILQEAGLNTAYAAPVNVFKEGDRVKIGDITGDVIEKNLFSTHIRTIKNVDVTIPNAMLVDNYIMNYSSSAHDRGLILHTTVTIGYDIPWKDVHKLLIDAAISTKDILPEPCPFVLQTGLNDFYVSYELNAYTREVNSIAVIYSELHQNIQDKFNEGGVEILSPHYSALRDGNQVTIPSNYVSEDYITPEFRIPRQVIFRNFQTEKNSEEAEMKSVED